MQAGRKPHQASHGILSAPKDPQLPNLNVDIESLMAIDPLSKDITIPDNIDMSLLEVDDLIDLGFDIDLDEAVANIPECLPGEMNSMPTLSRGAAGAVPRNQHMDLAPIQQGQQLMHPGAGQQPLTHHFLPSNHHPHPNQQLTNPAHMPFLDDITPRALPPSADQQQTFPFTCSPQLDNAAFPHPSLTTADTMFASSVQSTITSDPFGPMYSLPSFNQISNLQHNQVHQQQAPPQAQQQNIPYQMQIQQQQQQLAQQQMLYADNSFTQQDYSTSSLHINPDLISDIMLRQVTDEMMLQQVAAGELDGLQHSMMQQPMPAAAAALSGMGGLPAGLSAAQQLQLNLQSMQGSNMSADPLQLQHSPSLLQQLRQDDLPMLQPGAEAAEVQGAMMEVDQQQQAPTRRAGLTRSRTKASSRTKAMAAAAAAAAAAASGAWLDDSPFAPSSSQQQQQQQQQQQPASAPSSRSKPRNSGANSSAQQRRPRAPSRLPSSQPASSGMGGLPLAPLVVLPRRPGDSAPEIARKLTRTCAALQHQVTRRHVTLGSNLLDYVNSEEVVAHGSGARGSHAYKYLLRSVGLASEALARHAMSDADKLCNYIPLGAASPEQWGESSLDRLLLTVTCMLREAVAEGHAELLEVLRSCGLAIWQDIKMLGMAYEMPAVLAELAGAASAQQRVREGQPAAAAQQVAGPRPPSIHSPPAPHRPRGGSAGGYVVEAWGQGSMREGGGAGAGGAAARWLAGQQQGDAFSAREEMQLRTGHSQSAAGGLAGSPGHTPQPGSSGPGYATYNSGSGGASRYFNDMSGGDCDGSDSDSDSDSDGDSHDSFEDDGDNGNTSNITLRQLQELYGLPIDKAARKLSVGVTLLKKICRRYNIMRWPYRRLRSIDKLIDSVTELGAAFPGYGYSEIIKELRSCRARLYEDPNEVFDERIKKLRQAIFKLEHKHRQLAAGQAVDGA